MRKWYVRIDKKNFSLGSLESALMAAAISEMKILSTKKINLFFRLVCDSGSQGHEGGRDGMFIQRILKLWEEP